ncbi:MAG: hypothetical protein AAF591_12285 [Verrucomicrobiota bacterium]
MIFIRHIFIFATLIVCIDLAVGQDSTEWSESQVGGLSLRHPKAVKLVESKEPRQSMHVLQSADLKIVYFDPGYAPLPEDQISDLNDLLGAAIVAWKSGEWLGAHDIRGDAGLAGIEGFEPPGNYPRAVMIRCRIRNTAGFGPSIEVYFTESVSIQRVVDVLESIRFVGPKK